MKLENINKGVINFIDEEIMPNATQGEKIAITAAASLGILDNVISEAMGKALSAPILQSSKIWLNEEKTEIDDRLLEDLIKKIFSVSGKEKIVFKGFPIDLGFYKLNVFEGYVITPQFFKSLLEHIKAV